MTTTANLTDIAAVALANSCPKLTAANFAKCMWLTQVAHKMLAKDGVYEYEKEDDEYCDEYFEEDDEG